MCCICADWYYAKTLLMVIWTTIVSFAVIPFLQQEKLPTFLMLSISFTIWSIFVLPIMKLPINWIYRHRADMPILSILTANSTCLNGT